LTKAAEFADQSATGASTAVVASLSETGMLSALNLGDSVCIVVRDGKVIARTKSLIHKFDCPYQLSEDSPDRPKDGTKLVTQVQSGDFVVMGSDGIFDNLPEQSVAELVQTNRKQRAATLTRKIVEQSRRVSLDSSADTPYARLAKRNGEQDYTSGRGGKVDDASCIVVKCL
jgi:protein phosphatase PTC7